MYIDFLQPGNLATFILTMLVGLAIARIIKAKGPGGCLFYIIAIVIVIMIVTSLWKGYSYFIERISYNLESYIYYNFIGILGAVIGFLLGLLLFRK